VQGFFQQYFSNIVAVSFIGGGDGSLGENHRSAFISVMFQEVIYCDTKQHALSDLVGGI
jgi:hypothetical protein